MRSSARRRARHQRRDSRESGFTLIEVMIAMVIMGIGLLTMAMAQLSAMRMANESRQMSQAMYLAEQQLEAFYVNPPIVAGAFQDPGNPLEVDANDDDYATFTRSWTVQTDTPSAGLATVTVQVLWINAMGGGGDTGNSSRTVRLQGIVGL